MNDYVDQVIQDYLSYLEDGAPEPSLDHLTPEDRALAVDLINSLNAGRGIDPYQSRPSLDALLVVDAASGRWGLAWLGVGVSLVVGFRAVGGCLGGLVWCFVGLGVVGVP